MNNDSNNGRSRNNDFLSKDPFDHRTMQNSNNKTYAFKSLDLIKKEIDREMSSFKKEIR